LISPLALSTNIEIFFFGILEKYSFQLSPIIHWLLAHVIAINVQCTLILKEKD